MNGHASLNRYQKVLGLFAIDVAIFWIGIHLKGLHSGNFNYFYSFLFGLIPLFSGFVGMFRAHVWGGLKSALGRAVFFISLGLFCWGFGETIWSYYNFFEHVAAPYPSLADVGFAPSVFFWVVGAAFLSKASGAWLVLRRSLTAKIFAFAATVGISIGSYYLLVEVARGGVLVPDGESILKTVLDIAYPLGDLCAAVLAVLVFILSFRYFGGLYRIAIMCVLAGLGVMYVADFMFSWTTTKGTFYNADIGDLLLTAGLFLLSFGTLGLSTRPELKRAKSPVKDVG